MPKWQDVLYVLSFLALFAGVAVFIVMTSGDLPPEPSTLTQRAP